MQRLIYLSRRAAQEGLPNIELGATYRAAARFFDCGLVDRTGALPLAPKDVRVLDTLDEVYALDDNESDFAALCDARAAALVQEAVDADQSLQVLWSGGIDSTVALIALIRATRARGAEQLLEVSLSVESIREYPLFYREHIHDRLRVRPIAAPVSDHIDVSKLVVTGEHGDQLFGSHHLEQHVETGLAYLPWRQVLPLVAVDRLKTDKTMVDPFLAAVEPVMDACPRPVDTLFDFFWWANLALKWQTVALRVPVSTEERARDCYEATRHFFRAPAFQRWAIFARSREPLKTWRDYKMPAKQFIFEYTRDRSYLETKVKVPSLKEIFDGEDKPSERTPARPYQPRPIRPPQYTPPIELPPDDGDSDIPLMRIYMMDDFVPRRAVAL